MDKNLGWTCPVGTRVMHLQTGRIYEIVYTLGDTMVLESAHGVELEVEPEQFKEYVEVARDFTLH
jgi:hypothetical protein